jgi:hypothetical protein
MRSAGRRSAWTEGVHHGEAGGERKLADTGGSVFRDWRFSAKCAIGAAQYAIERVRAASGLM